MKRYVALDIETTSLDARTARIVELHMAEVTWPELEVVNEGGSRFNPGVPITPQAARRHRIADSDVEFEPSFAEWAEAIQATVENSVLIAYCGRRHDIPILHNELRRAGQPGLPRSQPVIDPYAFFVEDSPRTLEAAVQYYLSRSHPGAHSAAADVDAMLAVLGKQMELRSAALEDSHWFRASHSWGT